MSSFGFTREDTPGEGVREFYREQGRAQERERIIKLVEDYDFKPGDDWNGDLIALIKGEQE